MLAGEISEQIDTLNEQEYHQESQSSVRHCRTKVSEVCTIQYAAHQFELQFYGCKLSVTVAKLQSSVEVQLVT